MQNAFLKVWSVKSGVWSCGSLRSDCILTKTVKDSSVGTGVPDGPSDHPKQHSMQNAKLLTKSENDSYNLSRPLQGKVDSSQTKTEGAKTTTTKQVTSETRQSVSLFFSMHNSEILSLVGTDGDFVLTCALINSAHCSLIKGTKLPEALLA